MSMRPYSNVMRALIAFGALAATPLSAAAQTGSVPSFQQIDRNQDEAIDEIEARDVPGLGAVFMQADENRDRKLSRAEFAKAVSLMRSGK